MKTIKIARIGGEFINKSNDEVIEYLNPYTGFDSLSWHTFNKGKRIFNSINYESLLKEDDDVLPEYKMTREQHEFKVLDYNRDGYKPFIYLFTFEIPEYVWKNKEKLAMESGYGDDVMDYITDFTSYNWDEEEIREIKIPENLVKGFDDFMWIEENKNELQIKYMEYLIESGDENATQESFNMFMANEGRDIIEENL
jgi:hypothetical protein